MKMTAYRWRSPASLACLTSLFFCAVARAERPATNPADRQRQAWENVIQFYGDEDTNEWSLRIQDRNVAGRATFAMLELWRYDAAAKRWNVIAKPHLIATIVPPKEKPADSPEDLTQILYRLTEIEKGTYGLWFAKWRAEGVNGATFIRLGPARAPRKGGEDEKPPKGWLWEVVPLSLNEAEMRMIPDPRVFCVEDAPSTRPSR